MNDSKIIKEIQNIIRNKIEEFTGIPIYKVDINIVEFMNKN